MIHWKTVRLGSEVMDAWEIEQEDHGTLPNDSLDDLNLVILSQMIPPRPFTLLITWENEHVVFWAPVWDRWQRLATTVFPTLPIPPKIYWTYTRFSDEGIVQTIQGTNYYLFEIFEEHPASLGGMMFTRRGEQRGIFWVADAQGSWQRQDR